MGFPLYNYLEYNLETPQWKDDLGLYTCPKVYEISSKRHGDEYYADVLHLKDEMIDSYVEFFD
jgi:hypothetical protein